jgi:hypothetical protein
MPPSWGIGVRNDEHLLTAEVLTKLLPPLSSTAAIGSGDETMTAQDLAILLAFRYKDDWSFDNLSQPIGNLPHAPGPDPATGTVRPTLPEILRLIPNDLIKQSAGLVRVVIRRDDHALRVAVSIWPEPHALQGSHNCLLFTASVAVNQNTTVVVLQT